MRKLANPLESVIGSSVYDLLPPEASGPLMEAAHAAIDTGELARATYPLTTIDGVPRIWEARVVPSGPDEALAVIRDVTEHRQALEELRSSRARVVSAADAERRRIERNLHDGAQQRLVTVSLHLHLIAQRLRTKPESVPALLEAAQTELALGLEEIRQLVRHARATVVEVRVAREGELAVVEVADDGDGGADPAGSGLQGLADRVAALSGQFALSSVSGAGTALRAELPLRREPPGHRVQARSGEETGGERGSNVRPQGH